MLALSGAVAAIGSGRGGGRRRRSFVGGLHRPHGHGWRVAGFSLGASRGRGSLLAGLVARRIRLLWIWSFRLSADRERGGNDRREQIELRCVFHNRRIAGASRSARMLILWSGESPIDRSIRRAGSEAIMIAIAVNSNLTADPRNSPLPISPARGSFFGGRGADTAENARCWLHADFSSERPMCPILGFSGVEIGGSGVEEEGSTVQPGLRLTVGWTKPSANTARVFEDNSVVI